VVDQFGGLFGGLMMLKHVKLDNCPKNFVFRLTIWTTNASWWMMYLPRMMKMLIGTGNSTIVMDMHWDRSYLTNLVLSKYMNEIKSCVNSLVVSTLIPHFNVGKKIHTENFSV